MLTKTSLIMFIIFWGQLGYIGMSDSEKISKYLFKKKKDSRVCAREKWKKRKKYFSHQPVLKGPFAEVESSIRPFRLARLIRSAVVPLLT